MDGIEAFFDEFRPTNFWDTDNTKKMPASSWQGSQYRESDWKFYKHVRDTDPDPDPQTLDALLRCQWPVLQPGGAMTRLGEMDSTSLRQRRSS